jgi:hypothetical protein
MADYPTLYDTSATPQVLVGDDSLGLGIDDARQGFRKYNNHTHLVAVANNFLAYDVAIGDEVFIYDSEGRNYFDQIDAPVIDYISSSQIRVNIPCLVDVLNTTMYIKAPLEDEDNSIVIPGIDLTAGSKLISFNQERPRDGFLSTRQLELLHKKSEHFNFTFNSGSNYNTIPLYLWVQDKAFLQHISLYMPQGTATFYLRLTKSLTELQVESDYFTVTGGELQRVTYMEDLVPPSAETYTGFLTSPLVEGDLLELVVESITYPEGISQVMLVGTIDFLRIL